MRFSRVAAVCAAALLTGCGDEEKAPASQPDTAQGATAQAPAAETQTPELAQPAATAQSTPQPAADASTTGPVIEISKAGANTTDAAAAHPSEADVLYQQACESLKSDSEDAKKQAVASLTKAAELGHAAAQYKLGSCYRQGIGTAADLTQAVSWFEKAAAARNPQAQRELAFMYHQGEGVERDLTKAEQYYSAVTTQNLEDIESLVLLGFVQAENENRLPEAVATFRKAVEAANPYAQVALGVLTLQGRGGLTADAAEAYKLFAAAAEQGVADALCNQGYCLETGTGTAKDEAKAVECYTKAIAAVPLPQAKYNLALCYINGRGVPKDPQKAMPLLVDAANAGHPDALCELSRCCALGIGVPQDTKQAFDLCIQAAQAGSAEAQYTLARYFQQGEVTEKDESFARQCLETAAANGHELARKEQENK